MKSYTTNEGLKAALKRLLQKQGFKISKLYKGRVVWRSTYGLSFSKDIHMSMEEPAKNAVRIDMSVSSPYEVEYNMIEIFKFLLEEGFKVYMQRNSIIVVHHTNAF
ncbi:hypothetical protein [Bacillus paramobilis]|uniref:hypothetical protein n=1 Tax=Bacillus paramobilis TaxID=2817477 RepID=UPI001BB30EBC|nr:hypothetical protein [Bacillus paramobilis]HEF5065759.1 hypothetical protein [Bacillus cereus]HEF5237743.1 hypothetical protein [Bacillus cereus]